MLAVLLADGAEQDSLPAVRAASRSRPDSAKTAACRAGALDHVVVDPAAHVRELLGVGQHGAAAGQLVGNSAHAVELEVRADAGQQLAVREGLDEVVVGAGLEALDRGLVPARAESMTTGMCAVDGSARRARSSPKPSSTGIMTSVSTRSGGSGPVRGQAVGPVGRGLDAVRPGQHAADVVAHVGVVVDDQHAVAPARTRRVDRGVAAAPASIQRAASAR